MYTQDGKAHMGSLVSVVRFYYDTDGYLRRLPYKAICTVLWLGNGECYLTNFKGRMDKDDWRNLTEIVESKGVHTVRAERRKGIRTYSVAKWKERFIDKNGK